MVFEADKLLISRAITFVGFGHWVNNMFLLNINKIDMFDYMVESTNSLYDLWHARLGHVHQRRMVQIAKDNLIPSFKPMLEKCKTCMLTKITRLPFKSIDR